MNNENLRDLRRESGFTQAQLSKRLGFKQCSISRWESGLVPISNDVQSDLIDLFESSNGNVHPMIWRFIRRHNHISLISKNMRCLKLSQVLCRAFRLDPDENNGFDADQIFSVILDQLPDCHPFFSDKIFEFGSDSLEVDADLRAEHQNGISIAVRVMSKVHMVKLDAYDGVLLIESNITGPETRLRPNIRTLESSYILHTG